MIEALSSFIFEVWSRTPGGEKRHSLFEFDCDWLLILSASENSPPRISCEPRRERKCSCDPRSERMRIGLCVCELYLGLEMGSLPIVRLIFICGRALSYANDLLSFQSTIDPGVVGLKRPTLPDGKPVFFNGVSRQGMKELSKDDRFESFNGSILVVVKNCLTDRFYSIFLLREDFGILQWIAQPGEVLLT